MIARGCLTLQEQSKDPSWFPFRSSRTADPLRADWTLPLRALSGIVEHFRRPIQRRKYGGECVALLKTCFTRSAALTSRSSRKALLDHSRNRHGEDFISSEHYENPARRLS
jgi:hypothetical protein